MIRKHLILLALAAVVAALALAACGDDDDDDTGAATETTQETTTEAQGPYGGGETTSDGGGGETIAIAESEYKLDPAEVTAKAGQITFELSNEGNEPHNLEVEGNGVEEVSETIDGGAKTSFAVDLEPGTYEIYCAIGAHKELGMEGELTVN